MASSATPSTVTSTTVTTTRREYDALLPQWQRCRDCAGGSDAVKKQRTRYLPALDSHAQKPRKYDEYMLRALFYNATGRTIQGLSGAVFQKPPRIENVSSTVEEQLKDVTLSGEPVDMFGLTVMQEYLTTGRYGILVDMANEEATDQRPYWVGYTAEDIINWRYQSEGGDQMLCLLVLRELTDEPDPKDEFQTLHIVRYRVLRLRDGIYTQQLYVAEQRQAKSQQSSSAGGTFVAQEEITPVRRGEPLDFIPFALPWAILPPPLLDLVDVNLSHYRASADLKHGLHYTALPTPWVSGQTTDANKPLSIGSGVAWSLDVNGRAGMLEFSGSGLAAIRDDMNDMQKMMASLGARLLEESLGYPPESKETVGMRHSGEHASLRLVAQIVEQQVTEALRIHEWWLGTADTPQELSDSFELNKDYFQTPMGSEEVKTLLAAFQSDTISYRTFYERLQAGGWAREGVTMEEEQKEIEASKPVLELPAAEEEAPVEMTPEQVDAEIARLEAEIARLTEAGPSAQAELQAAQAKLEELKAKKAAGPKAGPPKPVPPKPPGAMPPGMMGAK